MNWIFGMCLLLSRVIFGSSEPQFKESLPVRIISQENEILPDGSYKWSFFAENSIAAEAQGKLEGEGTPEEGIEVKGSYSYINEGKLYKVDYTAGKGGFQPKLMISIIGGGGYGGGGGGLAKVDVDNANVEGIGSALLASLSG